jgi:citrate lyase subunit beta/citryl-CoA lyase
VPIVNRIFTPSQEEIDFNKGLLQAMEGGARKGVAAVVYKGDMVDEAMVRTAREMLDFARLIGLPI